MEKAVPGLFPLVRPSKAKVFEGRWSPHRAAADLFHSLLKDLEKLHEQIENEAAACNADGGQCREAERIVNGNCRQAVACHGRDREQSRHDQRQKCDENTRPVGLQSLIQVVVHEKRERRGHAAAGAGKPRHQFHGARREAQLRVRSVRSSQAAAFIRVKNGGNDEHTEAEERERCRQ